MFFPIFIGFLTGILSGFGIGGGSLLMLYLTLFACMNQRTAAGINLLYFIACAPAALISHLKNKLISGQAVLWCVLTGIPCTAAASFLASVTDLSLLRRLFGVLLLYIGTKELFAKQKRDSETESLS